MKWRMVVSGLLCALASTAAAQQPILQQFSPDEFLQACLSGKQRAEATREILWRPVPPLSPPKQQILAHDLNDVRVLYFPGTHDPESLAEFPGAMNIYDIDAGVFQFFSVQDILVEPLQISEHLKDIEGLTLLDVLRLMYSTPFAGIDCHGLQQQNPKDLLTMVALLMKSTAQLYNFVLDVGPDRSYISVRSNGFSATFVGPDSAMEFSVLFTDEALGKQYLNDYLWALEYGTYEYVDEAPVPLPEQFRH